MFILRYDSGLAILYNIGDLARARCLWFLFSSAYLDIPLLLERIVGLFVFLYVGVYVEIVLEVAKARKISAIPPARTLAYAMTNELCGIEMFL